MASHWNAYKNDKIRARATVSYEGDIALPWCLFFVLSCYGIAISGQNKPGAPSNTYYQTWRPQDHIALYTFLNRGLVYISIHLLGLFLCASVLWRWQFACVWDMSSRYFVMHKFIPLRKHHNSTHRAHVPIVHTPNTEVRGSFPVFVVEMVTVYIIYIYEFFMFPEKNVYTHDLARYPFNMDRSSQRTCLGVI